MDVWMTWSRKFSKCSHCEDRILSGSHMVIGKMWANKGNKLRFTRTYRWHPNCWIEQGRMYLDKIGYISPKRLTLSEEDRRKRQLLMSRWATAKVRLKKALDKGDISAISKLAESMKRIKEYIEPVGGVPKRWLPS